MEDADAGDTYTVGQVAAFAHVTVRTLHHYDEIGMLVPGDPSAAGYRRYSGNDLARLQRILFYRELGFGLDEITKILDDPDADPLDHLLRQHALLTERAERLIELFGTVEKTMEAHAMGVRLTPDEMFEVFGDDDPTEHAAEAEQRWGDTDAYRESAQRTSAYSKDDWLRIRSEADAITRAFATVMQGGHPADSAEALAAARAHRADLLRVDAGDAPRSRRNVRRRRALYRDIRRRGTRPCSVHARCGCAGRRTGRLIEGRAGRLLLPRSR
jgi:DNA-binding transcriptional MerR regulator